MVELGDLIIDKNILANPEKKVELLFLENYINNAINNVLNDKEKEIIMNRFGLFNNKPRTLQEVGDVKKISRERVRQIEAKALRKLKPVLKKIGEEYGSL